MSPVAEKKISSVCKLRRSRERMGNDPRYRTLCDHDASVYDPE